MLERWLSGGQLCPAPHDVTTQDRCVTLYVAQSSRNTPNVQPLNLFVPEYSILYAVYFLNKNTNMGHGCEITLVWEIGILGEKR